LPLNNSDIINITAIIVSIILQIRKKKKVMIENPHPRRGRGVGEEGLV